MGGLFSSSDVDDGAAADTIIAAYRRYIAARMNLQPARVQYNLRRLHDRLGRHRPGKPLRLNLSEFKTVRYLNLGLDDDDEPANKLPGLVQNWQDLERAAALDAEPIDRAQTIADYRLIADAYGKQVERFGRPYPADVEDLILQLDAAVRDGAPLRLTDADRAVVRRINATVAADYLGAVERFTAVAAAPHLGPMPDPPPSAGRRPCWERVRAARAAGSSPGSAADRRAVVAAYRRIADAWGADVAERTVDEGGYPPNVRDLVDALDGWDGTTPIRLTAEQWDAVREVNDARGDSDPDAVDRFVALLADPPGMWQRRMRPRRDDDGPP